MLDGDQLKFEAVDGVEADVCLTEELCWGCRDISNDDVRDTEEVCVVVDIIAEFKFRCCSVV